jgi:rhodanese-related sulfurtransferase
VLAARARIREVSLAEAEAALREADAVIDVREPDEYAAGHLPGAILVPRGLLEFKLGSDEKLSARDRRLLLYCKTSGRAALAAAALQEMGYLHVQSLAGGYDAWVAAGLPVARPEQPSFD